MEEVELEEEIRLIEQEVVEPVPDIDTMDWEYDYTAADARRDREIAELGRQYAEYEAKKAAAEKISRHKVQGGVYTDTLYESDPNAQAEAGASAGHDEL